MPNLIRSATANDVPQILQLLEQPDMDGAAQDEATAKVQLQKIQQSCHQQQYVVCPEDDPQTVLATYLLSFITKIGHGGAPVAIAEDVVVSRSLQGQGLGQMMMRHAMQQARTRGCYKLALSSNQKRKAAHAFYQSLGFVQHGYSFEVHP